MLSSNSNGVLALLLFGGLILGSESRVYQTMDCYEDNGYVNDFDGKHDNTQSQYFLAGQYSYHSNNREDRKFKWKYCKPDIADSSPLNSKSTMSTTNYDDAWRRGCGTNRALYRAYSTHSNNKEDRQWSFSCATLDNQFALECADYTWYVNSYDGIVNYNCPGNGLIQGIESVHNNDREDRIWKFKCCRVYRKSSGALQDAGEIISSAGVGDDIDIEVDHLPQPTGEQGGSGSAAVVGPAAEVHSLGESGSSLLPESQLWLADWALAAFIFANACFIAFMASKMWRACCASGASTKAQFSALPQTGLEEDRAQEQGAML